MEFSRCCARAALVVMASAFAASPLLFAPLAAQVARRDLSPRPEVKRLELNGVSDRVDLADLKANIFTTATTCRNAVLTPFCAFARYHGFFNKEYLSRQELKRDVLRIRVWYYKHGFREATVDTSVTRLNDKQVSVRFDIVEGPPTLVTDVVVIVDSTLLSRKRTRELTLLENGEPLDLIELDSTRVFLQNEMWELGYADALVDTSSVVDAAARTARVQLRIVPNHITTVGTIVITGAEKVAPRTVRNFLSFQPGDIYRRSAVLESQRTLYESNLFKIATLEVPASFDSMKTVNVLLREAPLREAHVGAGFNTVDFVQTDARYTHYNLLGAARRLDVTGTLGNLFAPSLNGVAFFKQQDTVGSFTEASSLFLQPTWQASASLTQPAFLRPRNTFGVSVFAHRRALPAVVIDRGYGANATLTRKLASRATASGTYRFETTRVEAGDAYFCVNFGVCERPTIDVLRVRNRLSPITLQAQVDRSDIPLAPTRGYTARAEIEGAGSWSLSNYAYYRGYAEGTIYSRLGARTSVLAAHLRLGFVRPQNGTEGAVLHPRKRFYAGGSQSVRGFGENQLGPRILTVPQRYLINSRTVAGGPCDYNSPSVRFCDPNLATDTTAGGAPTGRVGDDRYFTPRPLGGTSLLEGSVEYRFALPFFQNLGGAVFVDGAAVGERVLDPLGGGLKSLADLVNGTAAITPGFGVRYYSPVGPIRVDVGFNPSRTEQLAVVTEIVQNGKRSIVPLDTPKSFAPVGTQDGGYKAVLNRFTLHLSIGQAY